MNILVHGMRYRSSALVMLKSTLSQLNMGPDLLLLLTLPSDFLSDLQSMR